MTDHSELMRLAERVADMDIICNLSHLLARDLCETRDAIVAELKKLSERAGEASGVPEDWQLVPKKATPAMLNAFPSLFGAQIRYTELLSAAPTHEAQQGERRHVNVASIGHVSHDKSTLAAAVFKASTPQASPSGGEA